MFKTLGEKAWSRMVNYGRQWSAETAFSNAYMENIAWLEAWRT
jgi:hypothetical protein